MKKSILAFMLLACTSAPAFASLQMAQKYACIACHAVDKKLIGPSYQDVAAKYAKDKNAIPKLKEKIKKGGTGVWGQIPMTPHPQISDADLTTLVKWVLAQKKK